MFNEPSLRSARIIIPIGVITKKNMIPRMIGLVILCNNKPTRVHRRLSGDIIPGATHAARPESEGEKIANHQMPCPDNSGKSAIRRKTTAITKPNARSDEPTTSCFEFSIVYCDQQICWSQNPLFANAFYLYAERID